MPLNQGRRKAVAQPKVASKSTTAPTAATSKKPGTAASKKKQSSKKQAAMELRRPPPPYSHSPPQQAPLQLPYGNCQCSLYPYSPNLVAQSSYNIVASQFQGCPPPFQLLPPSPPPSPPQLPIIRVKAASSADVSRVGKSLSTLNLSKAEKRKPKKRTDKHDQPKTKDTRRRSLGAGSDARSIVSAKLDSVLSQIDSDVSNNDELERAIQKSLESFEHETSLRGGWTSMDRAFGRTTNDVTTSTAKASGCKSIFKKAELYTNARLPPNTPAFKPKLDDWRLCYLAAESSQHTYNKASGQEREIHIDADGRLGTKKMILKSVPIDAKNIIIFAIRGTHTLVDWGTNIHNTPRSPEGFLDDAGNLCHEGYLSAARRMMRPVAARLRFLLEENPDRAGSALIFTGHSAGGAVASLLFSHMVSRHVQTDLSVLGNYFRHVHCITFGTPPISLLPLRKPDGKHASSLFLSFINEGDPVPRMDKWAYLGTLVDLYLSPAPVAAPMSPSTAALLAPPPSPPSKFKMFRFGRPKPRRSNSAPSGLSAWKLPQATLSNAGELVVLRPGPYGGEDDVRALTTTDAQLRTVVYGDPMVHQMKLYATRIDLLATRAIKGREPT